MATVVALFDSDAEVSQAVSGLERTQFKDFKTRVVTEMDLNPEDPAAGVIPPLPAFTTGQQPIGPLNPGTDQPIDDVDADLLRNFFLEGIQAGGVLLVVEVPEDQEEAMVRYLKAAGGRPSHEE